MTAAGAPDPDWFTTSCDTSVERDCVTVYVVVPWAVPTLTWHTLR